ncbi:MAG: hypothetical protein HYV63_07620 [Candidatus Schekmanbacteria bacterium]|nr:hypothetical protein [Candidatus Schekmanbacteria bacterium]
MIGPTRKQPLHRLRISLALRFQTAWRIGSGREGETSDLGVLLDSRQQPFIPGSSLKGNLRATCERLASALGLSACMLDRRLSGVSCVGDIDDRDLQAELAAEAAGRSSGAPLTWIEQHTCDVCQLFGSTAMAGRIAIADAHLTAASAGNGRIELRSGVVLDRDSRTAREGLLYDFEVAPSGVELSTTVEVVYPTDKDRALLGAALFEWLDGMRVGGATSRGLGHATAELLEVKEVNLGDPHHRKDFLVNRQWQVVDVRAFLEQTGAKIAARLGGVAC